MAAKPAIQRRGAQRHARKPAVNAASSLAVWINRALVSVACLAVLAGAGKAGMYLAALQVERIAVSGVLAHVSEADIEQQVAGELRAGFLFTDLDAIQTRLERMPWVHIAEVRRHWPDTIGIRVVEQQPIARWGMDGFLNHEGEFFPGIHDVAADALPLLEGDLSQSQMLMQRYLRLEQVLTPMGIEVAHLSTDSLGQLEVALRDGPTLLLGNRDFALRLQRFSKLWRDTLDVAAVISIDMRYEQGAAVRERQSTPSVAAINNVTGGGD